MNTLNRIKVFACEAQPVAAEGLSKVLASCEDFEYVGSSTNLSDTLEAVRALQPDILLVDQTAGLKVVFQFLSDVRSTRPQCQPVLWVSDLAEIDCFRALQLGARGILKKTFPVDAIIQCLRSVGQGNIWIESSLSGHDAAFERRSTPRLTPREREIVHHVCAGMKNKEIAAALSITAGTVKVHLMHIFEKTGVKDRFELAVHGRRMLGAEHATEMARAEAHPVTAGSHS